MSLLQYMLPFFERTQMRRRWLLWFNHLRGYAYWRGVRDVLGSWDALLAYQAEAAPLPRASLDISDGLPGELPPLWVDGPMLLTVTWREQRLGKLYLPGSIESPLRSFLADRIVEQLERQLWIAQSQVAIEPLAQTVVCSPVPTPFARHLLDDNKASVRT